MRSMLFNRVRNQFGRPGFPPAMSRETSLKERLNKETLLKLHRSVGLPAKLIAERFGTSSSRISQLMSEYGIRRSRDETE